MDDLESSTIVEEVKRWPVPKAAIAVILILLLATAMLCTLGGQTSETPNEQNSQVQRSSPTTVRNADPGLRPQTTAQPVTVGAIAHSVNAGIDWFQIASRPVGIAVVGSGPSALVFDGVRLWVADSNDNTAQSIDIATGDVGKPISIGANPRALAFDGMRLWVANRDDNTVQSIQVTTGEANPTIPVGA